MLFGDTSFLRGFGNAAIKAYASDSLNGYNCLSFELP